jgi:hypothetical protein
MNPKRRPVIFGIFGNSKESALGLKISFICE